MKVMSFKKMSRQVPFALIYLAALVGLAQCAQAQKNLVYVESNIGSIPSMNSVLGYSNDGTGQLTPLSGSPYLTKGTGVYSPTDHTPFLADGQVIVNPEGTLLFAVNGHTNSIAVFNIGIDGSLTPVAGSPFSSGGRQPASLSIGDNLLPNNISLLTVVNKDSDATQPAGNPSYKVFQVTSGGTLTTVPNSLISLPAGSSPGQALIRKNGKLVFTLEFLLPAITSHVFQGKGVMAQVSQLNPPISGADPLGEALHPTQRVLYVGLPTVNQLAVYTYDSAGNLTFVETVPNSGDAICWMVVNKAGTRLYTAESESKSVSVYDLTVATAPVMIQHLILSGSGGPTNVALDPTEKFLYVIAAANLHVLNVAADGSLTETLNPLALPVPAGEFPLGLATLSK